jgi:hypothetical protein
MRVNKLLSANLRPTASERIANGQLPGAAPSRMWAGHGSGQLCALCDQPITSDDVEYEVEVQRDSAPATFRFHRACESVWRGACTGDDLNRHP